MILSNWHTLKESNANHTTEVKLFFEINWTRKKFQLRSEICWQVASDMRSAVRQLLRTKTWIFETWTCAGCLIGLNIDHNEYTLWPTFYAKVLTWSRYYIFEIGRLLSLHHNLNLWDDCCRPTCTYHISSGSHLTYWFGLDIWKLLMNPPRNIKFLMLGEST